MALSFETYQQQSANLFNFTDDHSETGPHFQKSGQIDSDPNSSYQLSADLNKKSSNWKLSLSSDKNTNDNTINFMNNGQKIETNFKLFSKNNVNLFWTNCVYENYLQTQSNLGKQSFDSGNFNLQYNNGANTHFSLIHAADPRKFMTSPLKFSLSRKGFVPFMPNLSFGISSNFKNLSDYKNTLTTENFLNNSQIGFIYSDKKSNIELAYQTNTMKKISPGKATFFKKIDENHPFLESYGILWSMEKDGKLELAFASKIDGQKFKIGRNGDFTYRRVDKINAGLDLVSVVNCDLKELSNGSKWKIGYGVRFS